MKSLQLVRVSMLITLAILGLSSARAQQQDLPQEVIAYADLVLYNGKVLTADDDFSIYEAVAVRDGKFLAVGQSDLIQRMAGPQTRQVDLDGRSVVPGLFDTHLHQAWVGQILKTGSWNIRLRDVDSGIQEIRAVVEGLLAKLDSAALSGGAGRSLEDLLGELQDGAADADFRIETAGAASLDPSSAPG